MGIFSRFENRAEDVIEGSGSRGRGGIEPVKLAKRASKEMEHEKMIGIGHEYAPTLYNILVSAEDDAVMSGYYPSLAGEIETYLTGQGAQRGLVFDCPPLVRFIVDNGLKRGKFDVIAESVSPAIIAELRHEEMVRYGLEQGSSANQGFDAPDAAPGAPAPSTPAPDYSNMRNDQLFDPTGDDAPAAGHPVEERTIIIGEQETPQESPATFVDIKTQRVYPLRPDRSIVGRDINCDVIIPDPSVSRRHAEVLHNESGWLIRDTGSTNGMVVNGIPTAQSRIYDGDIIDLGTTQLEFQEG